MSLATLGWILLVGPVIIAVAAYLVYPLGLAILALRPRLPVTTDPPEWPEITVLIPVHNEAGAIAQTLDKLLEADYPAERRHVLVISDASSDGTDEIVRGYLDRGVHLVRTERRGGKTAAENEAGKYLRGAVLVSIDATIRTPRGALKALVRAFQDETVGVASGCDVSVGDVAREQNRDESTYVGYEMWVRRLETRCGTIVGASGCFYALRSVLFDDIFPEALSRDFASPLIARERGFRSVSVDEAICFVPRTRSPQEEYRRKVRTMTRGLETLWFKRHLLNPVRYGRFAIFLMGHKLLRWLVSLVWPLAILGAVILDVVHRGSLPVTGVLLLPIVAGLVGYYWPGDRPAPRLLAISGFLFSSHVAGVVAWARALRGELNPVWEPTRRP